MKKAMISQPMNGIPSSEIIRTRDRAISWLNENGFTVENTLFSDKECPQDKLAEEGVKKINIYMLGKSLEVMSKVDTVYFCEGWNKARGCQTEHFVAKSYGLNVLYEE